MCRHCAPEFCGQASGIHGYDIYIWHIIHWLSLFDISFVPQVGRSILTYDPDTDILCHDMLRTNIYTASPCWWSSDIRNFTLCLPGQCAGSVKHSMPRPQEMYKILITTIKSTRYYSCTSYTCTINHVLEIRKTSQLFGNRSPGYLSSSARNIAY